MYNFDQQLDRRNTNSIKWDTLTETYGIEDLLPLWIADMDFQANDKILAQLAQVTQQGVLGYCFAPDSLYEAIIEWQLTRHHNPVTKEMILFNSGVVPSLSLAVQAFTEMGEAVMIHDPVYPPFARVVEQNDRKLVRHKLKEEDNCFTIDFEAFEAQIQKENVRLFILCNPHNPGGRVWTKAELQQLGTICARNEVLVVSDEIHQDVVFAPHVFTTFAQAGENFADFSITLTAATKTFNLAGIKNSMIFAANPVLKTKFEALQVKNGQDEINTFGYVGTEAAYRYGADWLEDLLSYLKINITIVETFLMQELPKVKMMSPQGTYLVWLDFSAYGLTDQEIHDRLIKQGKVVLNMGTTFGPAGTQHMRLNTACAKETLQEGLQRVKQAFADLEN